MKKMLFIAIMATVLMSSVVSVNAQVDSNKGGWVNSSTGLHVYSKDDAYNVIAAAIKELRSIRLSDGTVVTIYHPTEWVNLILQSYQRIDSSITKENLLKAIEKSEEKNWEPGVMPLTSNYYWSQVNNCIKFQKDFRGTSDLRVLTYMGGQTIKLTYCLNPNIVISFIPNIKPIVNNKPTVTQQPSATIGGGTITEIPANNNNGNIQQTGATTQQQPTQNIQYVPYTRPLDNFDAASGARGRYINQGPAGGNLLPTQQHPSGAENLNRYDPLKDSASNHIDTNSTNNKPEGKHWHLFRPRGK